MLVYIQGCTENSGGQEAVATVRQALTFHNLYITGDPGSPQGEITYGKPQSETAIAIDLGGWRRIVAYNDGTGDDIEYTANGRTVPYGASLLGYSFNSEPAYLSEWSYGGQLKPPDGWAVIWGDPAAVWTYTDEGEDGHVCVAGLAVPDAKFPSGGIVDSPGSPGLVPALGGACIFCARAEDFSYDRGLPLNPCNASMRGATRISMSTMVVIWRPLA
jgi:hypothetical protein